MSRKYLADKYFGGCKAKELQVIKYTTPKGNNVEAFICRKPNKYLGSLLIYKVNDDDGMEQFIPSMPKIHYLDNYHKPYFVNGEYKTYFCKEKLDGTCVILYVLKDKDGEVLEIVPKSRGMGVLDKQFMKKYERIDTLYIEEYLRKHHNQVLMFELYGMGNIHSIEHMNTYLDLGFIGYYDDNGDLKYNNMWFYNTKINALFLINSDGVVDDDGNLTYTLENDGLSEKYQAYVNLQYKKFDSVEECIKDIQSQLEELNKKYYEVNHRLAIEGVVLNYKNEDGECKYLKIKPYSIEMEHRSEGGIPRQYLMKELMKYLDEYGSIAKEEYEKSNNHYLDYMKRQLLEEFDELSIDKSEKKMVGYLEKRLYPKPKNDEIVEICNKLISEYPDYELVDYMRLFGQQYPQMKKHSSAVYSYLEEVL